MVTHGAGRNCVFEYDVRVDHRVEAGEMAGRVRIGQLCADIIGPHLAGNLARHRLPLAGGRLEAEVSVRGHSVSVHYYANPALMPFRIEIIEGHHIYSLIAEIPAFPNDEILAPTMNDAKKQGYQDREQSFHNTKIL